MSYPIETKIALVREYEQGKKVAEVSKTSGIPENSIYQWIVTLNTIMNGECTRFLNVCPQHSLRPSIVAKMIMTGRYKVTGHIFSSSVFNSFSFVP